MTVHVVLSVEQLLHGPKDHDVDSRNNTLTQLRIPAQEEWFPSKLNFNMN